MARVVAIGTSQGGVEALRRLVSQMPADFGAPVLIVIHTGARPSMLPSILNDLNRLPASHAADGERIEPGHIYIAPPDHHLLIQGGRTHLSRSPRENWTRPAIDPLFRSVSNEYGPDAVGVILTGNLSDGTAGLYQIKGRGGTAIVQDPADADVRSMPLSAVQNVEVDFCVPLNEMSALLTELVSQPRAKKPERIGAKTMKHSEQTLDRPVAQTCPDCGGAMREEKVGSLVQFRCHIGHVMNAEVMAAAQLEIVERDLSSALRGLNERAELCRQFAEKYAATGDLHARALWMRASEEAREREDAIRNMTEAEWIRPEAAMAG